VKHNVAQKLFESHLVSGDLEPGRYRVLCRVRDTTLVGRGRVPWVLRDEHGLLESERGWWVRVVE